MRRVPAKHLFIAGLLVLPAAVPVPGRTFTVLAECGGVAGPYPLAKSCRVDFGFAPLPKNVTLFIGPSTGFVGTLRAQVSGAGAGFGVGGFIVNGTLVPGTGTSSISVTLPPGLWSLVVDAGKPAKVCPLGCAEFPAFATGRFTATVLQDS